MALYNSHCQDILLSLEVLVECEGRVKAESHWGRVSGSRVSASTVEQIESRSEQSIREWKQSGAERSSSQQALTPVYSLVSPC